MKDLHPDIVALLALRATEGLTEDQQRELEALLAEHGVEDTDEYDLAAAAAANAFGLREAREYEDAPDSLKAKLRDDADAFFAEPADNVVELPRRSGPQVNWGWATAAALVLALIATNVDFGPGQAGPEAARQALIAAGPESRVIEWGTPDDPAYAGVSGNVVWNDAKQEGYMLLSGMPPNDPAVSQYQLWLVDEKRDSVPVDGGVFDIPAGRDTVVIPIDAKLAVDEPSVFAITREQPGGVVVSEGPLLVVAAAG